MELFSWTEYSVCGKYEDEEGWEYNMAVMHGTDMSTVIPTAV